MSSPPLRSRLASFGVVLLLSLAGAPAAFAAARPEPAPRQDTYLCPNTPKLGVDCFLEAVEHLYTMCRQVKSIEIIEFGYEKSDEGTNGAKSEYCIDKHRRSIERPLQAALREAGRNRPATAALKDLHDAWMRALGELKWQAPEEDEQYKDRVARPYDDFRERAGAVRTALATPPPAASPTRRVAATGRKTVTAR